MCLIKEVTTIYPDGRKDTSKTLYLCSDSIHNQTCENTRIEKERRTQDTELAIAQAPTSTSDGMILHQEDPRPRKRQDRRERRYDSNISVRFREFRPPVFGIKKLRDEQDRAYEHGRDLLPGAPEPPAMSDLEISRSQVGSPPWNISDFGISKRLRIIEQKADTILESQSSNGATTAPEHPHISANDRSNNLTNRDSDDHDGDVYSATNDTTSRSLRGQALGNPEGHSHNMKEDSISSHVIGHDSTQDGRHGIVPEPPVPKDQMMLGSFSDSTQSKSSTLSSLKIDDDGHEHSTKATSVHHNTDSAGLREYKSETGVRYDGGPMNDNDEVESVLSVGDDVNSSNESTMFTNVREAAARQVVKAFTMVDGICDLYEEGMQRMDNATFIRNHRRLLKLFYLNALSSATDRTQHIVLRFLRSRTARIRVSARITDLNDLVSDSEDEHALSQIANHLSQAEKLDATSRWAQSQAMYRRTHGVANHESSGNIADVLTSDDEDSDEDIAGEYSAELRIDQLAPLTRAATYITHGDAFKVYQNNLKRFVRGEDSAPKAFGAALDARDSARAQKLLEDEFEAVTQPNCGFEWIRALLEEGQDALELVNLAIERCGQEQKTPHGALHSGTLSTASDVNRDNLLGTTLGTSQTLPPNVLESTDHRKTVFQFLGSIINSPEASSVNTDTKAAKSLASKLQNAKAGQIKFPKTRDVTLVNKIQLFVEKAIGLPLEWWPLSPPPKPPLAGFRPIAWSCDCGATQIFQTPSSLAEKLRTFCQDEGSDSFSDGDFVSRSLNAGLMPQILGLLEVLLTNMLESLGNVFWIDIPVWTQTAERSCTSRKVQLSASLQMTAPFQTKPTNSVTGSSVQSTTKKQASTSQPVAPAQNPGSSQGSSSPSPSNQGNSSQSSSNQVMSPQASGNLQSTKPIERHIFVSSKVGGHYQLCQWETINQKDKHFFQELRQRYMSLRGFWRYYLGLKRFSHCDFHRLKKLGNSTFVLSAKEIPGDPNKPPLPEHQAYHYSPKPAVPNPPIDEQEFYVHFHACHHRRADHTFRWHQCRHTITSSDEAVQSMPRRETALDVNVDRSEIFWGLYIREKFSMFAIVVYNILAMMPSLAFFFWWLFGSEKGDLSNGAVPATLTLAGLSLFWAVIVGVRDQGSQVHS